MVAIAVTCSSNTPAADSGSSASCIAASKAGRRSPSTSGDVVDKESARPIKSGNRHLVGLGHFNFLNLPESRAPEPFLDIDVISGFVRIGRPCPADLVKFAGPSLGCRAVARVPQIAIQPFASTIRSSTAMALSRSNQCSARPIVTA